jgi:hypothetical protein
MRGSLVWSLPLCIIFCISVLECIVSPHITNIPTYWFLINFFISSSRFGQLEMSIMKITVSSLTVYWYAFQLLIWKSQVWILVLMWPTMSGDFCHFLILVCQILWWYINVGFGQFLLCHLQFIICNCSVFWYYMTFAIKKSLLNKPRRKQ